MTCENHSITITLKRSGENVTSLHLKRMSLAVPEQFQQVLEQTFHQNIAFEVVNIFSVIFSIIINRNLNN